MSPYVYTPLPTQDSIRLLELQSGKPGDPIICALKTTTISTNTRYAALSYVWGNPDYTSTIKCNGKQLMVTNNLAEALAGIRSMFKSIVIWADAICIDQQNIAERGHQVKHMASIYQRAKRVLVWLGPDNERYGKKAFQIAENRNYLHFLRESKNLKKALKSFREIARLPWFKRVWTTQEIGLASSATFVCGTSRVDWDVLQTAYKWMDECLESRSLRSTHSFNPGRISFLYRSFSDTSNCSFLQLIEKTRTRSATDPRDRVFALLSHPSARIDSAGNTLIEADYSMSQNEVYCLAAKGIIRQEKSLSVLTYVMHQDVNSNESATWAPQWHSKPYTKCLSSQSNPYNACGGFTLRVVDITRMTDPSIPRSVLLTSGFLVDDITSYSNGLFVSSLDSRNWFFFSSWWGRNLEKAYHRYGHGVFRAAREVLARGNDWDTLGRLCRGYTGQSNCPDCNESMHNSMLELMKLLCSASEITHYHQLFDKIGRICNGRSVFLTKAGYLGLGPYILHKGDKIFVLRGGKVPFVLRPLGHQYKLVGECYVAGLMNGEIENLHIQEKNLELI